ncbi:MAG: S9 family peptidase [Sphaerobacteraceae bacterium]|nr:MAG: S9 family peptidase [Sphaerobacteraceae bacterium]
MSDNQEKRPFEEVIVETLAPADPQLSPDGNLVVWTASAYGKKEDVPESSLWIASADGSEMGRQFTFGENNDTFPRWAPDGQSIAFLSDRSERGTNGIYVLPVAGGEARPLVQRKSSVDTFAWSPDGKSIAYLSADEPTDEDKRRKDERDDPDVYGERWPYSRLYIVDVDSGDVTELSSGDRHVFDLAWSPDSSTIAFLASPTPELESRHRTALYTMGRTDSEPTHVADANRMASDLIWTADGNHAAFTAGHAATTSAQTAFAVNLSSGESRVIGPDDQEPACVAGLTAVPGDQRLVLVIAQGLTTRLEWVDPVSGERSTIYQPNVGDISTAGVSLRAENGSVSHLAVIYSADVKPSEVFVGPPGSLVQVSNHHDDLGQYEFGPQEEFHWTAPDGLELDGVLIYPPNAGDGPHPFIVHIHGGPYGRYTMGWNLHPRANWQQWLAMHGYVVFMPNYRGGMGHGNPFASSLYGSITDKEFDDIMSGVDAAIERGIADPDRLGIGGWSGGGLLTAWSVGHTDRFKAGIMGAGVAYWGAMAMDTDVYTVLNDYAGDAPWDGPGPHRSKHHSPISFAKNVKTPLFIIHGKDDQRVPVNQATGFHRALMSIGAETEMVLYPREKHPILEQKHQIDMFRRVRDWYQKWV